MNFFDWLFGNKPKDETQDINVQSELIEQIETPQPNAFNALFLAAILSIEEIRNGGQRYDLQCREAYEQLNKMKSIGLGNSATAVSLEKQAAQYSHFLSCQALISRMRKLWDKLGEQTVILKTEHFIDVLSRHNLVCGFMGDYVGAIPPDALESYNRAYKLTTSSNSGYRYHFDSDVAWQYAPDGLPWILGRPGYWGQLDSNNPFCIAAPRACFRAIPNHKELDPFIFSCPMAGDLIVIHAKWGAEAEDATIRRYEQLRNAIIGKGGAR